MTERKYIDITREDRPAIYEIGVENNGRALKVAIHSSVADFLKDISNRANVPLIEYLKKELKLPGFKGFDDPKKPWGFANAMIPLKTDNPNWITWQCKLPKKKGEVNWYSLYSICASLNFLSRVLVVAGEGGGDIKPQLLELSLLTERGMNGSALSVKLARAFIPWIVSQAEYLDQYQERHPLIVGPMKAAYEHMVWRESLGRFFAFFRPPKWVNLSVPGNACGLDPEDYSTREPEVGYELLSHNVDTPIQQLSLLMGIAAMHDEARKASP